MAKERRPSPAASPARRQYWLFKTEPELFSIEDLEREQRACWEGVRNYQARNFLRDEVQLGDLVLIYHSSVSPPGVAGLARVARAAYPDAYALDPKSAYFDPRSRAEEPRWWMVDLAFVERLPRFVSLAALKADRALAEMRVVRRGQRLSIQPVDKAHFQRVLRLGEATTRVR